MPNDTPPLLALRTDADARIGAGHVMRCLALAQEWRRQGGEAVFLGRIESPHLNSRLAAEGIAIAPLSAIHPDPGDLPQTLHWLRQKRQGNDWLIVDGYHFDPAYHRAVRDTGWPLLVIDDYGHLPAYHADILVNPNLYADEMSYPTDAGTLRLTGSRYALLRREFRRPIPPVSPPEANGTASRILVTMGGADPDNVSGKVLDALIATRRNDLEVKIIIGPLNRHRQELAARLPQLPFHAELLGPVTEMTPLMRWAELAISAAGSTCWELAALGVPMAVAILAENQERLAASLARHGAACNLGWFHDWRPGQTVKRLARIMDDTDLRRDLGAQGQQLVDGQGCARLTRILRIFPFSLRPATAADRRTVFTWANDPEVRRASFQPEAISWRDHCQWFAARLADQKHLFLIVTAADGTPLGQIRFALEGLGQASISVGLGPELRGLGLGGPIIHLAVEQALADNQSLTAVRALIKPENTASRRAFAKAGFHPDGPIVHAGQPATALTYLRGNAP